MPKVPYPYELNGKLVTGNGSLIPICSLSNRSLLPSLTVPAFSRNVLQLYQMLFFYSFHESLVKMIFDRIEIALKNSFYRDFISAEL